MECLELVDPSIPSQMHGRRYCQKPATTGCYWCFRPLCPDHTRRVNDNAVCPQCASDIEQTGVTSEAYKNHVNGGSDAC